MRGGLALLAVAALAACSGGQDDTAQPQPKPRPMPTVAVPRTLVAADFDVTKLGAHVAGMDVTDVTLRAGKAELARLDAYVACPLSVKTCDPAVLEDGTLYTYVVTLTPAEAPQPTATSSADGAANETAGSDEAQVELVRMTAPALAFNGAVGFSQAEAEEALGKTEALSVTLDAGRIIWRVTGGSGWQPGKPITLWWQSRLAPAKGKTAYRLEFDGKRADFAAPFPVQKPVEPAAAR